MSRFENDNPFEPWNYPEYKNDPFAPHNDPMRRDDPTEPWNNPAGSVRDLKKEDQRKYGKY